MSITIEGIDYIVSSKQSIAITDYQYARLPELNRLVREGIFILLNLPIAVAGV